MTPDLRDLFLTLPMSTMLIASFCHIAAIDSDAPGQDDSVSLNQGKSYLRAIYQGRCIKVQRMQDPDYRLRGYFAKTARDRWLA